MNRLRVLCIDDNALALNMIARPLERNGYEVIALEDSTEALQAILNEKPDAIVTDIDMPGLNGWELVRIVRSWTQTALIPVVFLTKLDGEEDRIRGFTLGADDYLTKPVPEKQLVPLVAGIIEASRLYLRHVRRKIDDDAEFSETITMFGIPSFLSLLEARRKSGIIDIEHGMEHARVFVQEGRVFAATLSGHPECQGMACLLRVLHWSSGLYRFYPGSIKVADSIKMATTEILLEAATAAKTTTGTSATAGCGGDGTSPTRLNLVPSASGRQVGLARMARRQSQGGEGAGLAPKAHAHSTRSA